MVLTLDDVSSHMGNLKILDLHLSVVHWQKHCWSKEIMSSCFNMRKSCPLVEHFSGRKGPKSLGKSSFSSGTRLTIGFDLLWYQLG